MTKINKKEVEQTLSDRELELLRHVAKGLSRNQIAESMSISVLTYDQHRKNIRTKLQLKSKADWALLLVNFMD